MSAQLTISLQLSSTFRHQTILAFHRRDPQELAEQVGESFVEKGIAWNELPACLSIHFEPGKALARLSIDGPGRSDDRSAFESMVYRMLGLNQDIDAFETRYRDHPDLGQLIAQRPGLRVPVASTPFEALTWAVTGQQISVGAAVSLRRRLIEATNIRHTSGLLCYPGPLQIAGLAEERLRQAGFSATKTRTLLTLSQSLVDGDISLDSSISALATANDFREHLIKVRGIGPWTINYTLLRGFGWLDGSLHGDAAVRRGLTSLLDSPDKIGEQEAETWLSQFTPWRALVAAHLWAAQSDAAY